jgi:hypothetical protein
MPVLLPPPPPPLPPARQNYTAPSDFERLLLRRLVDGQRGGARGLQIHRLQQGMGQVGVCTFGYRVRCVLGQFNNALRRAPSTGQPGRQRLFSGFPRPPSLALLHPPDAQPHYLALLPRRGSCATQPTWMPAHLRGSFSAACFIAAVTFSTHCASDWLDLATCPHIGSSPLSHLAAEPFGSGIAALKRSQATKLGGLSTREPECVQQNKHTL